MRTGGVPADDSAVNDSVFYWTEKFCGKRGTNGAGGIGDGKKEDGGDETDRYIRQVQRQY